jgi:hypothetical protein
LKGEALGSEWEERKAGREEATSQIIAVVVRMCLAGFTVQSAGCSFNGKYLDRSALGDSRVL